MERIYIKTTEKIRRAKTTHTAPRRLTEFINEPASNCRENYCQNSKAEENIVPQITPSKFRVDITHINISLKIALGYYRLMGMEGAIACHGSKVNNVLFHKHHHSINRFPFLNVLAIKIQTLSPSKK